MQWGYISPLEVNSKVFQNAHAYELQALEGKNIK